MYPYPLLLYQGLILLKAGLSTLLNPLKIFDTPFHHFDVSISLAHPKKVLLIW